MTRSERTAAGAKKRRGPAKIAELAIDLDALGEPLVVSAVSAVSGRNDRLKVAINGVLIGDVTLDFRTEVDGGFHDRQAGFTPAICVRAAIKRPQSSRCVASIARPGSVMR